MKALAYSLALGVAVLCAPATTADQHPDPGVLAHLVVAEIDQEVLAEQYRHLKNKVFEVRLEFESARLKMKHASGAERVMVEQAIALQEERLELLHRTAAQTREELVHRIAERVALESEIDRVHHDHDHAEHHDHDYAEHHEHDHEHAEHHEDDHAEHGDGMHNPFNGRWEGHDDEGAVMKLFIERERARLSVEAEGVWFETSFEAEPRDDGLWEVALRILEGSEGDYEGKVSLGLAKVSEDRLIMALSEPGKERRPNSLHDTEDVKVFELSRR
jgi:hypothetical protein